MSSERLAPGAKVSVKGHGDGVVQHDYGGAVDVSIVRYRGLVLKVPRSQVEAKAIPEAVPPVGPLIKQQRPPIKPPSPPRSRATAQADGLPARHAIEALRFGLVPESHLPELTVGYQRFAEWAAKVLERARARPQIAEVSGAFGTGKSHSMALVRQIASKSGWIVARIEVDGLKVTMADAASFLYAMTGTLTGKTFNSDLPVLDLHRLALQNGLTRLAASKAGFKRLHDNLVLIQSLDVTDRIDVFADDIEAVLSGSGDVTASAVIRDIKKENILDPYDVLLRPPIGLRVKDRPIDLVKALAALAFLAGYAGYTGLAITVDEFEVEGNLTKPHFERFAANLVALMQYLRPTDTEPAIHPSPLALFVATIGTAQDKSHEILSRLVDASHGDRLELDEPSEGEQVEMTKSIAALYKQAYGVDVTESISELANEVLAGLGGGVSLSGLRRRFTKHVVAILDSRYGPP